MGGAQPLAVTMNGGVAICVDVRPARIAPPHRAPLPRREGRRPRRRAARWPPRPRRGAAPLSIGLLGNAAERASPSCCAERRADRHRHRPDLRARPAVATCPIGVDVEDWHRLRGDEARRVHRAGAGVDGPARRGDGRLPGRRRRGLRLRQLHPRRGPARRLRRGPSTSPASSRPTSGRCSARARARSAGPRSPATRPDIAATDRAILDLFPENEPPARAGSRWPARRVALPGPAGPDLLARLRRARPGRPAVQRDGRVRRAQRADRHRPRPPRLPARSPPRTARPRPWPTAPTPSPTGRCSTPWSTPPPAPPGCRSTTAAASASAARSTPARSRVADGTDLAAREARAGAHQRPRHGRHPPRRRRLRRGPTRSRERARRPHPDVVVGPDDRRCRAPDERGVQATRYA